MLTCACCGRQMPPQALYCAICGARMPHPLAAGGAVLGGRFQIQRPLSVRGQHLATFLGVEGQSGQPVVIKELRDDLRADPAQKAEFQNEVQRLTTTQVPGILPVRAAIPHDGRTYLVMPYLQGMTLRQMLAKQGRLTVEQAASVMRAVVTILDALHQQFPPMLHLDLTPDHILLSGWDRAMLLDGAWLKALGNPYPHKAPAYAIDYAAPEVVRGQAVPASDVYSLGVTILEALTGIPAARLHNAYANRVAWEPIPHPGLNELLTRMVDGSLGTRYGTAALVMQGLQAAMTGQPLPGGPAPQANGGFGAPQGFGQPQGFGAPQGFGQPMNPAMQAPQGFGQPPMQAQPHGFGQPPMQAQPQGFGQPMNPQQGFGQPPMPAQPNGWGAQPGMPPGQPGMPTSQPGMPPGQPGMPPAQPMAQAPVQAPAQPPAQAPAQPPVQPPQRPAFEMPKLTASAMAEQEAAKGAPAAPPPTPPPPPAAPPAPPAPPPKPKEPPKVVDNIDDVSTEEGLEALMALYEAQNS